EPFLPANADNFLKLERPKVVQIAHELRTKNLTKAQQRKLCHLALTDLLKTNRILPLGEIQYITLMNKTFAGIELNALNQLDLAKLRKLKPDQSPSEQ